MASDLSKGNLSRGDSMMSHGSSEGLAPLVYQAPQGKWYHHIVQGLTELAGPIGALSCKDLPSALQQSSFLS